jgi:hypothetical protein
MQRPGRQEKVPHHHPIVHGTRWTGLFVALAVASLSAALAFASTAGAASPMPLDPDQAAKVSSDVNTSLLALDNGTYQLLVQNQSGYGSIDSFAWVPGPGWHVTSVIRTSKGKCVVNAGALACNGQISPPKKCLCQPGGQMTIVFRMTGPKDPPKSKTKGVRTTVGTTGGYFLIKTVTLAKHHIPSAVPTPNT